jgi:uncharacterized short protein YbdD (DUF466 family)
LNFVNQELKSCPIWLRPFKAVAWYLNEIAGVPNYQRYLEHFRKHHPGEEPMSEEEFHRKMTDEKYGGGKIRRCC